MTRVRGELPEPEEALLGIQRPTPEQEAAEQEQRDKEAELERAFLRHLMEQDIFRAWLMKQLVAFDTFGRTFAVTPTGFPDNRASEYHLGMKAAGWHLWTIFDDVVPDLASKMRREFVKKA